MDCPYCHEDLEYDNDIEEWKCPVCGKYFDVDDDSESLSVYDAAVIWASHGKDEDYTFGFTEEELEDAL